MMMLASFAVKPDFMRFAMAASLLTLLGTTSACGGPKPGGQTIAVVDGQPVTESELSIDMGASTRQADQQKRNLALDSLINRKIFVAAAKQQGLDKDPNFKLELDRLQEIALAKRYLAQATAGVGSSISDADINNYLAANPQFGPGRKILLVDQIQFSMPTEKKLLAEMRATKNMSDLTQVLQKHHINFKPARANLDSAVLPSTMYSGLLKSQSGEPLVLVNGDSTLAQVLISATDAPATSDEAQRIARSNLQQERVKERLRQQAEALRGTAKIEYSQGYGPANTSNR
jgi:peptidyl-prolyl cis-trans isomerase C